MENFTVTYTPTQVGAQTGQLAIGSAFFTLKATGGGPNLTFSYASAGTTVPVPAGSGVVFGPIAVSQSETENFIITNSGTDPATVSLVAASAPFSVPTFTPVTIAGGKSTTVPITFTPVQVGPAGGTLFVNSTSIPLIGSGTAPPALPSYTISGPSGTVAPSTQQAVGLTLASPFAADINGVLTLTTDGGFGSDPAVQFSVGSSVGNRTVDFVIPANTTSANFVGQGSQIFVQTGTVAETVTLTPSFTTGASVNLTPTSPTTLQFTVGSVAPVLESIVVTNETSSSFELILVGYSTTRSLSNVTVNFIAAPGFSLATSSFTADLTSTATHWFQSNAAQTFGGQFQVAIPFNLTGPASTKHTLLQTLAGVSATISNSVGASNALQAVIP